MRGKSRFGAITDTYTVSLTELNNLAEGSVVDFAALRSAGLIKKSAGNRVVARIVANGKLTKKLKVSQVLMSEAAKAKFNE
jgi:hypothetical protein